MKTYEQQSRVDSDKLQALRQTRGKTGKTLHIYLLCSLPGVRVYARVVALVPNQLRDSIAKKYFRLDLSIIESTLVLFTGSTMSEEGQAAFVRWNPRSA
jgi:hypothetical protein